MTSQNPTTATDVDKALLGSATYRSLGEQKLSPKEERFEKGFVSEHGNPHLTEASSPAK